MFWTVAILGLAVVLVLAWRFDRRADRRRGGVVPRSSPRHGQGDQLGGSYGTFAPPPDAPNRGQSAGGPDAGMF